MLGPAPQGVKAFVVLFVCCAVGTACLWSRYPERVRTHGELLVAMARKGRDLVVAGRFTAESLPELTYPLERARAFAGQMRARRSPPPASLDAFETLVERYRVYVDTIDRVRRDAGGRSPEQVLDAGLADVEASAAALWAALAVEGKPEGS